MGLADINLALLPDDPHRIAAPGCAPGEIEDWTLAEQVRHDTEYAELKEWHAVRVRDLVIATLAGHRPFCDTLCEGRIQTLDAGNLYEVLTEDASPLQIAKLLASPLDWEAKSSSWVWVDELINDYADKTAAFLATREMNEAAA